MFGMRFHESHRGGDWGGGRHGRGRWGRRGGWDEMQGRGGGEFRRAGRMLAHGDLRLIALALIAEQPRHGYDIIKQLEEKTAGWYSPSPGIVYPCLTYLEEAGRAYLEENRDLVEAVMNRLAYIGKKAEHMRRRFGADDDETRHTPRLVQAA